MLDNIKDKVITEIKTYLGADNINYILEKCPDKNNIYGIYTSRFNMVGISIRNFIRNKFPEVDEYFTTKYHNDWYGHYEDWIHQLIVESLYNQYELNG